jgi:hypothetical protein
LLRQDVLVELRTRTEANEHAQAGSRGDTETLGVVVYLSPFLEASDGRFALVHDLPAEPASRTRNADELRGEAKSQRPQFSCACDVREA